MFKRKRTRKPTAEVPARDRSAVATNPLFDNWWSDRYPCVVITR